MCIQYGFKTGLSKAKGCRGWYEGVVHGKVDRLDYVFVTKNCCICILYNYIIYYIDNYVYIYIHIIILYSK